MSEEPSDRVESRAAHLLPEEAAVGSDDPEAQAAAVLAESDRREAGAAVLAESDRREAGAAVLAESDPRTTESERRIAEAAAAPDSFLERRSSAQTVTPDQTPDSDQTPDLDQTPDSELTANSEPPD
ncbi:hypothetical protein [Plantactinospora mayteni]|nr:hypothetical protein [Plantactinospora mayteni]